MNDSFVIQRLLEEGPIPLCVLRREVPPGRGKLRSMSTLLKWVREGVRGIKLEAYHDGTRWFSSRQAVARFLARLTGKEAPREEGARAIPEARRAAFIAEGLRQIDEILGRKPKQR